MQYERLLGKIGRKLDQLRRVLLLARIVERGSGNNPEYQQNRSDFGSGRKPPTFGLFLQIR